MKKFFTLLVMALMAVGVNAEEVVLLEQEITCDNWSGVGVLSDEGIELKEAGAQPGDILKIYADVSSAAAGWQLLVQEGHYDKVGDDVITYAAFSESASDFANGYATFELTEAILKRAYTKSYWGNVFILNGNGGVKVSKIALVRPVSYSTTAKNITFDDGGIIKATEFEGLNERAKVVFTYNYAGEPSAAHKGWSIGRIGSNDDTGSGPSVQIAELPCSQKGDMTVTVLLTDIKKALAATPDGIVFQVWNMDEIATTRVKVEAYDALYETWTVAGATAILGSSWKQDDANNDMKTEGNFIYTLVKENCTLEKGTKYEYKVTKDHAWTLSYPSSNAILNVEETAIYTVTFTFNTLTNEVSATAKKTGDAEAVEHTYDVRGNFKGDEKWEISYEMTKGSDGIFTVSIADIDKGKYEFKVRQDNAWDISFPSSNYPIEVTENGSTVTITFDPATTTVNATVTAPTGITAVKTAQQDGVRYNLAGQKVNAGYKGVVIMNGKKFVVK